MITFTLDLEDHRSDFRYEKRYPLITRKVLSLLAEYSIKGTFFVVGDVVKNDPDLIEEIATQGHELAFHSFSHKQLRFENKNQFLGETKSGKDLLEQISGQKVIGYRAPVFSLTRETLWVIDSLKELGFLYSSSVMPVKSPLNGFPEAPKSVFYWNNGLLEIPVPVAKLGPLTIPYLGGVYLRYLPLVLIKKMVEKNREQCLWSYCHPYDFDPKEPYFRIKGAGQLTSLILWFNRKNTMDKIRYLISLNENDANTMTFAEQYYSGYFETASVFDYSV